MVAIVWGLQFEVLWWSMPLHTDPETPRLACARQTYMVAIVWGLQFAVQCAGRTTLKLDAGEGGGVLLVSGS
jgi:hypothetical protein